jgi:hypothetical protein
MKGLSRKVSSCGRPERPLPSQFRRDPLDQWTADDGSRWRGPAETMALMPLCRLGPPPRSLAADAHVCIMVRIQEVHRIQGCRRDLFLAAMRAPPRSVIPTTSSLHRARSYQERGTTRAVDPTQPACRRARRCKGRAFGGRCAASLDIVCARRRRQSAVGAKESLRRGRTKERRVSCGWAQAWPARANERALALAEGQKKWPLTTEAPYKVSRTPA